MVIAKVIVLSIAGAATVLDSTSPLMHIGVTKNNWINKWYPKTEELSEPILKDCQVDSSQTHYTVFIDFNEGTSQEGSKISFRVEKTTGKWKKDGGEVVWKDGKKVGGDFDEWYFGWKNEKEVDFMYPANEWGHQRNQKANCQEIKIQPTDKASSQNFGSGHPLSAKSVQPSLSTSDCQHHFSSVVCGINIDSSNKLKWKEGKEPKITYTAIR